MNTSLKSDWMKLSYSFFHRSLSLFLAFFVVSCGGDDPEPTTSDEDTSVDLSTEDSTEPELDTTDEPVVPPPPSTKKEDAPDPNGVFLPIYEIKDEKQVISKKNDQPAFSNGDYFLWFNGSVWRISTQLGGGRMIASGGEKLSDPWPNGVRSTILSR